MSLMEKVLNEVSLDPRIKDGVFSIEENTHMDVLREYFIGRGIAESDAIEYCNVVLEGKYPERQAYNQKGILVTFPTAEYKQRAIQRGTHFEKDPTKGQSNLFGQPGQPAAPSGQQAPQPPVPQQGDQATPAAPAAPVTNLPLSQTPPPTTPPEGQEGKPEQTPQSPATAAAPVQVPSSPAEPVTQPEEPAPEPPPKSPAEKDADEKAIKQMLRGDDYMLEQVVKYIVAVNPNIIDNLRKKTV